MYLAGILFLVVIAGIFAVLVGIANSGMLEPRDWPSQRNQFKTKL